MKNFARKVSISALALILMGCIVNSVYTFTAQLSSSVGNSSTGVGYMDGSTQDSNTRLVVSGRYSGLSSAASQVVIVSPIKECVLVHYPDANALSGGFEGTCYGPASQADIDNVNNGLTRIVVRTMNSPNGEISGVIRRTN
jgi:hypothetical protein